MNNKYTSTKSLVEAGLLATLIVVIMLFNVYMPIFSSIGIFILPIPVTILYIRHNFKFSALAVAVSAILIAMLYSPISAIINAVTYGLIGFSIGYSFKNQVMFSKTLLLTTAAALISMILNILITLRIILGMTVIEAVTMFIDTYKTSVNQAVELATKMGIKTEQFAALNKSMDLFTPEIILAILPGVLIASAFFAALINYLITNAILKKLRYNTKEMPPFEKWYIDNRVIAAIVSLVLLGVLLNSKTMELGNYMTGSLFIILIVMFTIDGMAVSVYYFRKRFNMKNKTLIIIIVAAYVVGINSAFLYLGVADTIFDFRKVDVSRRKNIK